MRYFKALALGSVSLVSLAAPAFAQNATPAAETGASDVTEIIVTARRRDERLQDVPLVVNAVTAEDLQKQNIRNVTDVQTLVPGLQLKVEANGIGGGGQIRGIQYDINTGANPTVQFYLNDAVITALAVLQQAYDVGQIEVQRGPQGTLRGEASPSGSITITTKKPDLYEAGGYISTTANDIGTLNFNGAVGIPIVKGIAAIRVAGVIETNDQNRVKTIAPGAGVDRRDPYGRSKSGRISALVTPVDWLHLEGVYQRIDNNTRNFDQYESYSLANPAAAASNPVITPGNRQSIQETPRINSSIYNIYNWRAEVRGFGQKLIYQGEHYDFNLNSRTNQDLANFLVGQDFYQTTNTRAKYTTHEARLQNEERVFDMFDYVVGYFHSNQLVKTNLTQQTPVLLPAGAPFFGGLATIANTPISVVQPTLHEQSFFGSLTAHIGASTEVSAGLRNIKTAAAAGALVVAGNPIATPATNDKGTIYTASIKHNFTRDFLVYANTGTSRRPGPHVVGDFSAVQSALEKSFLNLPSETSRNYEIGFKSSWLENRLQFNVAAFHQTFKNYPYRNPTGVYYVNTTATVTNGVVTKTPGVSSFNFVAPVPVTVNGAEVEANFKVTPEWNVNLLGSYALGKIKNGVVPCNDLNGDGIPDATTTQPTLGALQAVVGANNLSTCRVTQRSAFQSPFSATVQSEYHHPISSHLDGFVRGLFNFYGASQGDPNFDFDQAKSYGLVNLFIGIREPKGGWDITLYGKNIFDTTHVTQVGAAAATNYQRLNTSFQASAATATSNYTIINTNAPREFGLTARFAFGSR